MSETDPFSDAAFLGRLQKLLPMLGSQQPGEADAARRKLIDHLGQHKLTLLDVAGRLRDAAAKRPGPPASFVNGAREISLERQLAIARHAKEEAAQEALVAGMRIRALESDLQRTTFELARVLQLEVRTRAIALFGWIAVAGVLAVFVGPRLLHLKPPAASSRPATADIVTNVTPRELDESSTLLRLQPGERRGTAAVQDLAIRLAPNDQATVRAFLNRGEPMFIAQEVRIGTQTWLLIRTATVRGWARSGDVFQP